MDTLQWQLAVVLLLTVGLLVPVVVVPGFFFPYVVPRNILFRIVVELAAAVVIVRVVLGKGRLDFRREYVLFALGGFLVASTISAGFSQARSHSFFGDFERMGGVWAWLHLALFYLVLRTLEERPFLWLLNAAVGVSAYASVHGIVEHFSEVWSRTTGGLSLVGNPGLFAGYLLIAISLALYLASAPSRRRWLYLGVAAVDLVALVMTQNRSSVLGLLAGAAVAAMLLFLRRERAARRWVPFASVAGLLVLFTTLVMIAWSAKDSAMASAAPGVVRRLVLTDFAGRDASRVVQWDAAVAGFRDRPILGHGPENHHLVWSAHFNPRIYELGTEVFDRTHNMYLEVLATTGIVGAAAFVAIWCAIGYSLFRALRQGGLRAREFALLAGVNVAYATYLLFWFIDINAAMLWMLAAALIAGRCKRKPVLGDREPARSGPRGAAAAAIIGTVLLLASALYMHAYVPLRASAALATLDAYNGDSARAFDAVRTLSTSSAPQTSHTGPVLAQLIARMEKRGELAMGPPDSARRKDVDRTFETAIAAFDAELRRDPLNDRLHTVAASVLIEASRFYGSAAHLERSIALLERAIELNPRRREQRRLLETAYSRAGNARRHPPPPAATLTAPPTGR